MVQPINYMGMIPQPDLARSLASGLQLGTGIREMQQQRVAAEQAQAAKQQLASDVEAARADGSQQAWLGMIAKYPQFREAFAEVRKGVGEEQVKSEFFSGFEISNALEANQPLVAAEKLRTEIAARKNSGKPAGLYEQALARIEEGDNKRAQSGINEILSVLDPDRFEKTMKAKAALPQDGFTILPEADRVRANLPEGVYQKGPKGEIKLLSAAKEQFKVLTPAEVKAVGLPPGTYQQGPTGEIKTVVKEPLVSVSVGQQGQRDTLALKELDIPRAQEFSGAAASARTLARDARVISNLLKGKGGGAVIKLGADIAKNFGFTTDTVVANDLANSLAIRGATQMRPPGSGSTSDIEFKAFVSAFPSLANSEGGRELMAKYADAFAKRTAKIADHARKLIRADNYSEEEIARFDESLGPILDADFYDLSKQGRRANVPVYTPRAAPVTPAAPAAAPAVLPAATAPRTVDSVLQQYLRRQ
jgi:hypothetical protein